MTDKSDWLAGLKEGDPVVVVSSSPFDKHGFLATVAKFTPTQIVTQCDRRFQRKSGDKVGESGYRHTSWLTEPTAEREVAIKAERTLRQVESIRWKDVPVATQEAVLTLVTKALAVKAGKAGR